MSDDLPAALPDASTSACCGELGTVLANVRDYVALTKPEVNALIVVTTAAGFYLASIANSVSLSLFRLVGTVAATLLLASGAATLNQVMERRYDALMKRTLRRPVAAGRIPPAHAFLFGAALASAGAVWLFLAVNATAGFLGGLALVTYLLLYTPLKRKTPFCTAVGAIAGAVPPLIGWSACGGRFDAEALLLYALLFLWQFPHVMSIAALYRTDYERAGYRIIPRDGARGFIAFSTIVPCTALLALIVWPAMFQGKLLLLVACVLSLIFLLYGIRFSVRGTAGAARRLLAFSIVYVPLALVLLIFAEKYRVPLR
ncbi:MAG TPA: heme o synthase [Candidatus Acidoferrales bacterium]|nr:heme o synthase [Candidatus Acidoferrales bacterium]